MAKVSSIEHNKHRGRLVERYAGRRARLKAALMDRSGTLEGRFQASLKLAKLPRNGSRTRLCNRCILTGRVRSVMGSFGLSRIKFRELALAGQLPGVIKSSW